MSGATCRPSRRAVFSGAAADFGSVHGGAQELWALDLRRSVRFDHRPMNVVEARAFAVTAHGDQRYGEQPYSVHLDAVAKLAAPYGEAAQVVAYLHDAVEDTQASLDDVCARFGELVAECVGLLTDAEGANRKERKAKTYARLATVTGAAELALIVKAADRLANVRACVAEQNAGLWQMYRGEHAAFRGAAYRAGQCEPIWVELDGLLAPRSLPSV